MNDPHHAPSPRRSDDGPAIQSWGASLLDQLLFQALIPARDAEALLGRLRRHPHPPVRETAAWIDEFLQERQAQDAQDG